jgi:hypothetical protein
VKDRLRQMSFFTPEQEVELARAPKKFSGSAGVGGAKKEEDKAVVTPPEGGASMVESDEDELGRVSSIRGQRGCID